MLDYRGTDVISKLSDSSRNQISIGDPLPGLTIPTQYRAGVAIIGSISESEFSSLVEALKRTSSAGTAEDLGEKIAADVPSLPKDVCAAITSAMASMQGVQRNAHVDADKFSEDVWAALNDDSPKLIDEIKEETLKSRVATLLTETSIQLTSVKVADLRREVERRFCSARILTDARTAFPDDASIRPAMTILQTLELTFHDDTGQHREFYVSLDDEDLLALKEVIERAEQKKLTLVEALRNADFQLFD